MTRRNPDRFFGERGMRYIYWAVFAAALILVVCVRKMIPEREKGDKGPGCGEPFTAGAGTAIFLCRRWSG